MRTKYEIWTTCADVCRRVHGNPARHTTTPSNMIDADKISYGRRVPTCARKTRKAHNHSVKHGPIMHAHTHHIAHVPVQSKGRVDHHPLLVVSAHHNGILWKAVRNGVGKLVGLKPQQHKHSTSKKTLTRPQIIGKRRSGHHHRHTRSCHSSERILQVLHSLS